MHRQFLKNQGMFTIKITSILSCHKSKNNEIHIYCKLYKTEEITQ